MLRLASEAFLVGEMDRVILQEHRGRCLMCSEMVALQWPDVLKWYGLEGAEREKHV